MANENVNELTDRKEFIKALEAVFRVSEKDTKPQENYRYVLYARRSTDDKDKQVRSLPDQIADCQEYAKENNLRIADVVQEKKSAKEPDIRPRFRQMIEDVKRGKYDGIIAWHPDRLARNMKDAGEVIDLLDKGRIKDLRFKSFSFENSASGKMLLGITFVLSKHYSDHLSDSVSRGNARSVIEGKYINKAKHGYIKDKDGFLQPDKGDTYNNFVTISEVFTMRLNGDRLEDIAKWVNSQGYSRLRTRKVGNEKVTKREPYKMDKQKLDKILRDPIYTGVLMYGKAEIVDLTDLYGFVPMVSIKDFMRINKLSRKEQMIKLAKSYRKGEAIKADLMRQMIRCSECGEMMHSGITNKKSLNGVTRYFYYRCDTDGCPRYGKSMRAKVVMDYVYKYLDEKPFSCPSAYEHYKTEMGRVSEDRISQAKSAKFSLEMQLRKIEERLQRTKDILSGNEDEDIKREYRGDIRKINGEKRNIQDNLDKAKELVERGKESILTYEKFLELADTMASHMRKIKNMSELDLIVRKIFLNFSADGKKVIESTLNEPFRALAAQKTTNCGR